MHPNNQGMNKVKLKQELWKVWGWQDVSDDINDSWMINNEPQEAQSVLAFVLGACCLKSYQCQAMCRTQATSLCFLIYVHLTEILYNDSQRCFLWSMIDSMFLKCPIYWMNHILAKHNMKQADLSESFVSHSPARKLLIPLRFLPCHFSLWIRSIRMKD